jgi:hypothetical protein
MKYLILDILDQYNNLDTYEILNNILIVFCYIIDKGVYQSEYFNYSNLISTLTNSIEKHSKISCYNQKNQSIIEYIYDILKECKQYRTHYKNIENLIEIIQLQQFFIKDLDRKYNKIINLFSNCGELLIPLINNNIEYKDIVIYDNNNILNNICYLNILLSFNINLKKNIIKQDVLHDNIDKQNADLLICNMPTNFKNIIYANCNNQIKNLKIRGTKAEPLILQLILQMMNVNGDIVLITPNSLLFGESKQHVETRKYLLTYFNILKIYDLHNKRSILIIKNNNNMTNINFIKNNINNKIDKSSINTYTYSLYFDNMKTSKNNLIKVKLDSIISIVSKVDYEGKLFDHNQGGSDKQIRIENELLYNYKFNDFNISHIGKELDYNYLFITKDETILKQYFINIYLKQFFINNINKITKGKMANLSLELINNLDIPIISISMQENIIKQYKLNKLTIDNNKIQIENYDILLNNFIENMIYDKETIKLSEIIKVNNKYTEDSKFTIKKNSLTSGAVDYINDNNNNPNYYYLSLNNEKMVEYYYNILKYYEKIFFTEAKKNQSVGISKNYLDNLDIPILLDEEIEHINHVCNHFNLLKTQLNNTNNNLNQFDIIKLMYLF